MAEYKRGEMDIEEHQRTFEGFVKFWMYLFGGSILILVLLALFNG
jgi:Bacterial aa3 type cytochrome c oxidase subunit IV